MRILIFCDDKRLAHHWAASYFHYADSLTGNIKEIPWFDESKHSRPSSKPLEVRYFENSDRVKIVYPDDTLYLHFYPFISKGEAHRIKLKWLNPICIRWRNDSLESMHEINVIDLAREISQFYNAYKEKSYGIEEGEAICRDIERRRSNSSSSSDSEEGKN